MWVVQPAPPPLRAAVGGGSGRGPLPLPFAPRVVSSRVEEEGEAIVTMSAPREAESRRAPPARPLSTSVPRRRSTASECKGTCRWGC